MEIIYEHTGTISFADREVNAATGAIRIAGVFPNPEQSSSARRIRTCPPFRTDGDRRSAGPQRAVTELQGSHQVAVVSSENKVSIRPGTVGDRVGKLWIVTDGLKAGERVVVEGLMKVRDGAVVNVVAAKSPQAGG